MTKVKNAKASIIKAANKVLKETAEALSSQHEMMDALQAAADEAELSGTAEEKEVAAEALAAGATALGEAEAAVEAAEIALEAANAPEPDDELAASDEPDYGEVWLLRSTTEFVINHPRSGARFNQAVPMQHAADKFIRRNVAAKTLEKIAVVGK